MTIIDKVKKATGIEVRFVRQTVKNAWHKIEKKDLEIINSHKFEIIKKAPYNGKYGATARCKECEAEADFEDDTIYCFLNIKNNSVNYFSCSELIMQKALE